MEGGSGGGGGSSSGYYYPGIPAPPPPPGGYHQQPHGFHPSPAGAGAGSGPMKMGTAQDPLRGMTADAMAITPAVFDSQIEECIPQVRAWVGGCGGG